jgi:MFS family permease
MTKYLILILLIAGCACLGLPTKPTTPIIPTPLEQLWNAAKQSNWLVSLSILGIAAGVFALMNGSKIGIPAAIASCVSLFMTLAVARFATWMAVCGIVGSVLACAASILLKNKAVKELILGVQRVKESNGNKDEINKLVTEGVQTKSTQKLVQKIKSNLKVSGEI